MNILVLRDENDEITSINEFTHFKEGWGPTGIGFYYGNSYVTRVLFETVKDKREMFNKIYDEFVTKDNVEKLVIEIQSYRNPERIKKHMVCPKYVEPKPTLMAVSESPRQRLMTCLADVDEDK